VASAPSGFHGTGERAIEPALARKVSTQPRHTKPANTWITSHQRICPPGSLRIAPVAHSTIGHATAEVAAVNIPNGWASTLAPSSKPANAKLRKLGRRSAAQVAGSEAIHSALDNSCGHTPWNMR
jgi:hypothetical protein